MQRTRWALIITSIATATWLAGCEPKAGDSCQSGQAACKGDKTALACQGGKYIEVACKGPKGCYTEGATLHCDFSANAEGDVCSTDHEGSALCGQDAKQMVSCEKGKFVVWPCRGPKGCKESATKADCDTSLGQQGDRCKGTGYACAVDGASLLKCDGGKAVLDEKCPAGQKCKQQGNSVGCSP